MQTTINTKYNIGDTVYTIGLYHDYYPISKPYTVKNILINGNVNNIHISYEIENDELIECVPEGWLFSSCAECTKWCEKQNKSL